MSFNDTIVNPSSFFTYKEAINFINSVKRNCNSDKDCPYDSSCISNNCIISFYCNENDTCSFYETLCDGKPCKKRPTACTSNNECLSNICFESERCTGTAEYTSGTFTFKDAYKYYKENNVCEVDTDCPNQASCTLGECVAGFYCKENDDNICSFDENTKDGIYYNNFRECKANEDCLSGVCINGKCERTNKALVSRSTKLFGLEDGEKCTKNSQCYSENCEDNGTCGAIQNLVGVLYILVGLLVITFLIVFCILWKCCCSKRKNNKTKKNITQV